MSPGGFVAVEEVGVEISGVSVVTEAVKAAPCLRVTGARMVVLPRESDIENLLMCQDSKKWEE